MNPHYNRAMLYLVLFEILTHGEGNFCCTNIKGDVGIGLREIGSEFRDGTGSGLCPTVSFDICDVEPLSSVS
jgi:hypothetical protein